MTAATTDSLQELEELGPELEILAGRMPDVQFTQVPNWVFLADGIKPQAQALYVHLVMHLNRERGDKQVWPSQKALAARLGLNRVQSLTPYFKQLEELGALDMQITRYQSGMRQRYVYTVHLVPPDGYDGPLNQAEWYAAHNATTPSKKTARAVSPTADAPPATTEPQQDAAAADDAAPATEAAPTARKPRKRGEKTAEEKALDDKATRGAEWWWGARKTQANPNPNPGRLTELVELKKIAPYVGNKSSAYHATRTLILNALKAGYDSGTIATALENGGRAFPSRQQFEDACARAAGVDVDRARKGGARAPYDDEATWGALKQQKAGASSVPKAPVDDDEFGLRDLADSA
ncbi:hypothetical protein [Streptomyces sp. NPDC001536]|uniref:hypothetical protein n=1 Tax=Streptomyces sp. NPDC001536 TaxID=3364583 RepID=UPI003687365D